ncbi:Shedu immune nuclease family protein [Kosakonia radicincitans]|uniref:Shedu immune nuclease family protein n=1 Tax=Kosakonia radicincitans TaxID=283686 RepID=UPI0031D50E01
MSIDHSYLIGSDGVNDLRLNISGLDRESQDISNLKVNIFAYCSTTAAPRFTCQLEIDHLRSLYQHLSQYSVIRERTSVTGNFVEVHNNQQEIMQLLEHAESTSLIMALQHVINNRLTNDDINTILGRKDALCEYQRMFDSTDGHIEPEWQSFFENNEWIFGYGLRYKYLSILQREAHISHTDLNGSNDVITDFLISDSRFTKIVELKTPQTSLFVNRQNRADSWRLSNDLTDAVSQILAQKANWEIESQRDNYTVEGDIINEKTYDPECILIIGTLKDISGTEREKIIKRKTFELYRRNLKNIDIICYDELLERAKFIVRSAEIIEEAIGEALTNNGSL